MVERNVLEVFQVWVFVSYLIKWNSENKVRQMISNLKQVEY